MKEINGWWCWEVVGPGGCSIKGRTKGDKDEIESKLKKWMHKQNKVNLTLKEKLK